MDHILNGPSCSSTMDLLTQAIKATKDINKAQNKTVEKPVSHRRDAFELKEKVPK